MGDDKAEALGAARARLHQAKAEVHKLLDACERALAAVENDPQPRKLGEVADSLGAAQRKAGDSLRAAQERIRHAVTAVGQH